MDGFQLQQLFMYVLILYKYIVMVDGRIIFVDFWDMVGQEWFQSMYVFYYYKVYVCIMVFDVQRKVIYRNLSIWYIEFWEFRLEILCIVVVNKIDVDINVI